MKILKYATTVFLIALMAASAVFLYNCTDTDSSHGGQIAEAPSHQSGGSVSDNKTESATQSTDSKEPDEPTQPEEPDEPTQPEEPDEPIQPEVPEEPEDPKKELTNPAPSFTVLDYNGNQVQLSDYIGKPIVLNFWATWCYYCEYEMPDFERARQENPDVIFLMVNATDSEQETVESIKKYIEDNGYGFTVVFDTMGQAQSAYHITGFPTTYFIDEVGNLVAYARGAISYNTIMEGIRRIK